MHILRYITDKKDEEQFWEKDNRSFSSGYPPNNAIQTKAGTTNRVPSLYIVYISLYASYVYRK